MRTGILFGIVEKSKTRVECIFCGVCIPKAKRCIEQHSKGARHKETIELMAENGLRMMNNKLHCKLCCVDVEEGESVAKHLERDDHSTWMVAVQGLVDGEFINLEQYFKTDDDEILCEACNCPFAFTLGAIEQHVNWFNHRTNLADKLKPLHGLFPVESDAEVWCKICNAYIQNNTQAIMTHVDHDGLHLGWFEEMEEYVNDEGIDITNYLTDVHKVEALCSHCNEEVLCNIFSIESHIHGQLHRINLQKPDET